MSKFLIDLRDSFKIILFEDSTDIPGTCWNA